MSRAHSDVLAVLAVACGVALSLAVGLGHPVQNLDEGLYAQVAQGMLHGGSWVVPTLDGVPYLEKPPLVYWVTALGFAAFGVSNAATRIAPLLGSVLMLASVAFFAARHLGRRVALYAVLVLASCPLFVGMARTLLFDSLFTGLLSAALVAMHEALAGPRPARWMRASAAFLGAAILAKGLAAPVFYAGVAVAVLAFSPRGERRRRIAALLDPAAFAILLAIALPWHVAAWIRQPGFAWFYLVNEHLMRFLGQRVPHDYHSGPPWYYLPRIFAYAFPWALLLFLPARTVRRGSAPLRGFVAAWMLVPLAIFSLSVAKGDYYMIVGLPPLAILLADRIESFGGARRLAAVPIGWIVVLAAAAAWLWLRPARFAPPPHAGLVLACAFALCALSLAAFARGRRGAGVAASAAMAIPLALLFSGFIAANADLKSSARLAQAIRSRELGPVYLYRDYEKLSALPFYLGRPVGVIDSHSMDLWYGLRLRPDKRRFPSVDRFERSTGETGAAVVVADSALKDFRASPLGRELEPVGAFGEAWLFARPPAPQVAAAATPAR